MNKRYSGMIIGMLMLFAGIVVAQEQPSLRDRADELYSRYEYANAVKLYTKLVDIRKPRLHDLERLADSYSKMNDYESAENWYARVVQHADGSPENLLRYGEILKMNGKYAEAKKQLEKYASQTGNAPFVAVQLAGCDSALRWMSSPTLHRLQNEALVNTVNAEFSVFPVGNQVYYTGEPMDEAVGKTYGWTGNAFLRVYTAPLSSEGNLGRPSFADSDLNNGKYHIGPVVAEQDGKTLYVTRTYTGKEGEQQKVAGHRYRTQLLELYRYQLENGTWVSEPFAYNNVKNYSVGHAALSTDASILYFSSDMPGGHGGTDIWYSERQANGTWGDPVNAGTIINSAGDELFPSIGPDGTLYYSSDGFPGMGGLDVFRSMGSKSQWSSPENLKYPVNSASDDFAYLVYEEDEAGFRGFLASDRKGGKGGDDIYSFSFSKPKIIIILKGTTSDKATGNRLPATTVTLYDGARAIVAKQRSSGNGTFEFVLDRDRDYTVLGQKEGYHADSSKVSTQGITQSDTLEVALLLEPIFQVGQTFELENIYYDFDKYNIRRDAAVILDELVRTLRDNPTLKIELSSHTDSRGSHAYNEILSQRRAQSAVDYLVSRGIERARMVAKGYGETRLVNRCADGVECSAAEHQANRRTEVTILEY
ncbi:OmpA family protein [Parapedobacter indicus]|uniref:Outer membrane protein OmpA n=1 Tax=Parapedobacter indicus TaxID=1477437 RepID=A0A1I3R030_9SPHI|nr:OmpA family protein [Parapedobacter indicus]PPL00293.1 outer membrane protein OmpA-like peptidoglycan-associated protein [Parapedobacter indicus]SFJ39059.1 Outer membrane protein OmpA [Parapedobacter indicus]